MDKGLFLDWRCFGFFIVKLVEYFLYCRKFKNKIDRNSIGMIWLSSVWSIWWCVMRCCSKESCLILMIVCRRLVIGLGHGLGWFVSLMACIISMIGTLYLSFALCRGNAFCMFWKKYPLYSLWMNFFLLNKIFFINKL